MSCLASGGARSAGTELELAMKLDLSMLERGAPASMAEAGAPIMEGVSAGAEFGAAAFPLPAVADVSFACLQQRACHVAALHDG